MASFEATQGRERNGAGGRDRRAVGVRGAGGRAHAQGVHREREGTERSSDPSLYGGAAVPLDRSLWSMCGSTPRSRPVRTMHRRAAGSQRPVRAIRAVKFDAHGVHLTRTKSVLGETRRRHAAAGNRGTVEWIGGASAGRRRIASGQRPCPLDVGQPSVGRRRAWPAHPMPTLCHRKNASQEMHCKFV